MPAVTILGKIFKNINFFDKTFKFIRNIFFILAYVQGMGLK